MWWLRVRHLRVRYVLASTAKPPAALATARAGQWCKLLPTMSNRAPHVLLQPSSTLANDNGLRAVLRRALKEALAPTIGIGLGVIAACGDGALDPDVGGAGGGGGQSGPSAICGQVAGTLGCTPGFLVPNFDLLTPAEPVEHWITGVGQPMQEQLDRACAEEADLQECRALVNAAVLAAIVSKTALCGDVACIPNVKFLATRSGNEVRVATTSSQLAKLLAPIETAAEADFVARFFSNMEMKCGDERMGVWCAGDSFSVVSVESTCPPGLEVMLKVKVPHDGSAPSISEMERKQVKCVVPGRLPDDCTVAGQSGRRWETLSAFFSDCAALEAASVPAFMLLAEDLRALEAPSHLIEAALHGVADEARHAAVVAALAHSSGSVASICVEVASRPRKSLFHMALENAVEGCVRETYGALVGAYQAVTAQDASVRATFTQLVEDEVQHASLSHAIAMWAHPQLSHAQRAQIAAAQRAVIETLKAAAQETHAPALYRDAGYPQPRVALGMLRSLERTLWNANPTASA